MKRFQLLLKKVLPYLLAFLFIYAIMFFGSRNDGVSIKTPIAAVFDDVSFSVTADQISETYTVANIANTVSLPSTATISENYVTINAIYESTGTTNTVGTTIEMPKVIDVSNLSRGVVTYTVKEGDTIASILKKLEEQSVKDVTEEQVRHSNGIKSNKDKVKELKNYVGKVIYIPSIPGIIHEVKKGETIASIAKKYGSNEEGIIARNDLENKKISVGMHLLLPDGKLPKTESPDYVAPRRNTGGGGYSNPGGATWTAVSSSGSRQNRFVVGSYNYWRNEYNATRSWHNPGAFGNCTWFAWYWRRKNMPSNYWLPSGVLGNARSWASTLSARGFVVNKTPAYGAVVQTSTSGYGHVGVVVGVNQGTSITIQEMNYGGPQGKLNVVYQSTINWSDAVKFNYIHARR